MAHRSTPARREGLSDRQLDALRALSRADEPRSSAQIYSILVEAGRVPAGSAWAAQSTLTSLAERGMAVCRAQRDESHGVVVTVPLYTLSDRGRAALAEEGV